MHEQQRMIAICGLEGAGKTTVLSTITDFLSAAFPENQVRCVREPGGTPLAEHLRALVKSFHEETVSPVTELMIMMSARLQLSINVIQPSLQCGEIVVSDRFWGCSFAYQVAGRQQIAEADFWSLHQLVMNGCPEPSLVIYLDLDPRIGLQRARGRGTLDAIESRQIDFFDRARQGYHQLMSRLPMMKMVDASQSEAQVAEQVTAILKAWLLKLK